MLLWVVVVWVGCQRGGGDFSMDVIFFLSKIIKAK